MHQICLHPAHASIQNVPRRHGHTCLNPERAMEARPAGRRLPPHTTWPRGARVRERAPEREGRSVPMPTAGVMLDGTTEAGASGLSRSPTTKDIICLYMRVLCLSNVNPMMIMLLVHLSPPCLWMELKAGCHQFRSMAAMPMRTSHFDHAAKFIWYCTTT